MRDWERLHQSVDCWCRLPVEDRLESRRVFHGRGRRFAGFEQLTVEWFQPVLLITLFEEFEEERKLIASFPEERFPVLALQRRYLAHGPVETVRGMVPPVHEALEEGLRFRLALGRNQNHGFFLDMKPGRDWIRRRGEGKSVLNLFSYTCALSVAAIAGGASSVVNLDMSKAALKVGRENHHLNFQNELAQRVSYLPHNLFKSWGGLKRRGPYDLIVVDPPSFQPGSFEAAKDYRRVLRRMGDLASPDGGDLLACVNAPELDETFLPDLVREECPWLSYRERLPEHPEFCDRERSRGLKLHWFSWEKSI